jgi:hypothetical protein
MADACRYLVSYGLEIIIGGLCNTNGLVLCSDDGDEVVLGDDSYYDEVIAKDSQGFDFAQQRRNWKFGTDFSFTAEFFAYREGNEEQEYPQRVVDVGRVVDSELVGS